MTNNNVHIEHFVGTDNDNKIYNKQNCPTSWIKYGELFCNELGQPKFVCSICLENSDNSISNAFNTSEVSVFWWHIQQQHISGEYETIHKTSSEIESFETNSAKSEVSYGVISTRTDEPADINDYRTNQNELKILEEFHDNLVKNNVISQTKEKYHNSAINKENQQDRENISKADVKETKSKEDFAPLEFEENKKYSSDFSHCNYYYDENATYTISDDEDEGEEDGNQELLKNETNYLKHNDMIEISDDEFSEDNVDMRLNSPPLANEKNRITDGFDDMENNTEYIENKIEESSLPPKNLVTCIPTPDISPCESLTNFSQINNHSTERKTNLSSNKKRLKTFRAFQCRVCGVRTINEKNMQTHLERFHKFLLGTNQYSQMLYHTVYQSLQNKQQDVKRSFGNENVQKKPFKCKICKTGTKTVKAMERHQQLYHSPDLLKKQCEICHKRILAEKLQLHMQIHFSAGFNCKYCGVVYKQKHYLNIHINMYHADRNLYPQHFGTNFNVPMTSYEASSMQARLTPEEEQQFTRYLEYEQMCRNMLNSNTATPQQSLG